MCKTQRFLSINQPSKYFFVLKSCAAACVLTVALAEWILDCLYDSIFAHKFFFMDGITCCCVLDLPQESGLL
jgi:hypothetical protein